MEVLSPSDTFNKLINVEEMLNEQAALRKAAVQAEETARREAAEREKRRKQRLRNYRHRLRLSRAGRYSTP